MDREATVMSRLTSLVGLRLCIARDAAGMKNFQFGEIRPHPSGKGTVGDFALHVQCPWRLVTTTQVLTGSADYYESAVEGVDVNQDDHQSGNLQRKRLQALFQTYDAETRSLINQSGSLTVISLRTDRFGGLDLELSGGVRLQVFPDGSSGENWRFFSPGNDEPQFIQ
jgi:hypothetical protein